MVQVVRIVIADIRVTENPGRANTGLNEAQVKVNIFRGRQALKDIIGNPNNLI